jgi:RNA polymerase sigma-70 factor (ECF subfamily)
MQLLELSASGTELTAYHIEAAIASVHATAQRVQDTDWSRIISLYDSLMRINTSPIVALNRAIAIAQRDGPERALNEIKNISSLERFARYPFYPATLGVLELSMGNHERAREHFQEALAKARNAMERRYFEQRLAACEAPGTQRTVGQFWESSFEPSQTGDDEEH